MRAWKPALNYPFNTLRFPHASYSYFTTIFPILSISALIFPCPSLRYMYVAPSYLIPLTPVSSYRNSAPFCVKFVAVLSTSWMWHANLSPLRSFYIRTTFLSEIIIIHEQSTWFLFFGHSPCSLA